MSIKWLLPIILLVFLFLIPTVSADSAVTLEWNLNRANEINDIHITNSGEYVMVTEYGNITMYSRSGTIHWYSNTTGRILKSVLSAGGEYYAFLSESGNITYGNASTGEVVATYYYLNASTSAERAVDVDLTEAGTRILVVTNSSLYLRDKTNATLGNVTFDYNAAGLVGNFSFGTIDPDGTYGLGITDAIGTDANKVKMFVYDNNTASGWYVDYLYRKSFTVTGPSTGWVRYYPVNISIYNTTGTSSGSVVYIGNSRSALDWDDIRFTKSDGTTLVQQWYRQQWSDHVNYSIVYPYLDQSTGYTTYMYFGNNTAPRYSNSSNSVLTSSDYNGGFDFNTYSTLANASFDAEVGSAEWGCGVLTGNTHPPTTTGAFNIFHNCSWDSTRKTNWSYSRKAYAYAGAAGTASWMNQSDSNITFTLSPNPNGAAYGWNLSFDWGKYGYGYCWRVGGIAIGPAVNYWYVYINGSLIKQESYSTNCDSSHTTSMSWINVTSNVPASTPLTINITSYSQAVGSGEATMGVTYAQTYSLIDHLMINATWTLSALPTAGSWSQIEGYSELEYTDQESLTGNVKGVDMPWNNPWLAVSTSSRLYDIYPAGGVLGTVNSYATTADTPTGVSISDAASYLIEGRGIVSNVYSQGLTIVGTHSAGNTVNTVAISTQTGQWAISGSADGRAYVFSKYGSSTWEEYWASDSLGAVTASAFSPDGDWFSFGNTTGGLWLYETEPSETATAETGEFYPILRVTKNGVPYAGANVSYYNGDVEGDVFVFVKNAPTDSYGNFIWQATPQYYYRFIVFDADGDVEGYTTIQASSSSLYYTLNLFDQFDTTGKVSWNATWNNVTRSIDVKYYDYGGRTDNLTITIRDLDDKGIIKYQHEYVGDNSVEYSYLDPSDHTHSYKIEFAFYRDGKMQYADPIILKSYRIEVPISKELRIILACIFLMFVAGLFGVRDAGIGAFVLCGVATGFYMFEILPIPAWVIPFAWVMAFLNYARKGGSK